MKRRLFAFALTGLLLAIAQLAWAMDEFDAYVADIRILQQRPVQQELGLTEAQRNKMNEHAEWFDGEQRKLLEELENGQPPSSEQQAAQMRSQFQEKLKPKMAEMENRVLGVLTASQLKRLREISLQAAGYAALADPKVAEHIGLSQEKITAITSGFQRMQQKVSNLRQGVAEALREKFPNPPQTEEEAREFQTLQQSELEKIQPQITQAGNEYKSVVEEALNPVHRAAFEALLGEPFRPQDQ